MSSSIAFFESSASTGRLNFHHFVTIIEMILQKKRNQYRDPNILFAVMQVLLDLTEEEHQATSQSALEFMENSFGEGNKRQKLMVEVKDGLPQSPVTEFAGYEHILDSDGSGIIFGSKQEGLIVHQRSRYINKDYILGIFKQVASILEQVNPGLNGVRFSVAVKSNIPVNGPYDTKDWIIPNYEFDDKEFEILFAYNHDVWVDLKHIREGLSARIVIESAKEARKGIDILVDVLYNTKASIVESLELLDFVKNVETNIYESIITDKTRELNGIC